MYIIIFLFLHYFFQSFIQIRPFPHLGQLHPPLGGLGQVPEARRDEPKAHVGALGFLQQAEALSCLHLLAQVPGGARGLVQETVVHINTNTWECVGATRGNICPFVRENGPKHILPGGGEGGVDPPLELVHAVQLEREP